PKLFPRDLVQLRTFAPTACLRSQHHASNLLQAASSAAYLCVPGSNMVGRDGLLWKYPNGESHARILDKAARRHIDAQTQRSAEQRGFRRSQRCCQWLSLRPRQTQRRIDSFEGLSWMGELRRLH